MYDLSSKGADLFEGLLVKDTVLVNEIFDGNVVAALAAAAEHARLPVRVLPAARWAWVRLSS